MAKPKQMPREKGIDHSIDLLREGYQFIPNRRKSFQSNIFMTRLFGKKTICMGGTDAAKIFYDTKKFQRKGAAPNRVVQTLFGANGVQTLDGKEHQHRKALFMSIMAPAEMERLKGIVRKHWENTINKWERMKKVILYDEMKELLCRAACEWAGVPVQEEEMKWLTKDLAAMFESAAAVGPKHWRGTDRPESRGTVGGKTYCKST